ncbi:MAG TPA: TolC family protein [Hyphomonas sp.]|nr:TolC family protein [Hyphomonas sp.]
MKHALLAAIAFGAFALASPAGAEPNPVVDLMEQSVRTAPSVLAAEADMDRAGASAARLRAGPYEFEINATGGQRKIDDPLAPESRYTEWAGGVSRTVRLPGKQRLDRDLARIETDLADAALGQALYHERLAFADLWSAWLRADLLTETSSEQAAEATRLAELEQITVDKGAGRQIRADQLTAEASLMRLQAEQDRLTADAARAALMARYPDAVLPARPLMLNLTDADVIQVLDVAADQSPTYRTAQLVSEQARLRARRARADETPDPTFGMEFTNEFGGGETSLMARVTIPIGGSARKASTRELASSATVAELNAIGTERQLQQLIETSKQSALLSLTLSEEAARAMEASTLVLGRIQQGYTLGEITISDLITSRRSHLATQRTAAEQRAALDAALLKLIALTGGMPETES